MKQTPQPNWIDVTLFNDCGYEEQLDLDVSAPATASFRFRHRERRPSGQSPAEWRPGPAPSGVLLRICA